MACHSAGKFLIFALAFAGQHGHGDHREGQDAFSALVIEPVEEEILQFLQGFPLRLAVIRKHKFAEHAVEVELIVNRDIPEHTLVATGRRRLINGVHHMLQMVGNLLGMRGQILIAIILAGKVIEVG